MLILEKKKYKQGWLGIWWPKAKIDYLVLYTKLRLINMNYIEFFLFLEIL